jgi:phosphatidylglycerol:prolipoprotein diacylglycerol transferase
MTVDQLGIHIGIFYFRFYALILVGGAFAGAYLASLNAQRKGYSPDLVWDGLIWALLGGIVGARIWHILTPPPSMVQAGIDTAYYLNLTNLVPVLTVGDFTLQLPAAIALSNGGLGLPGAVAGGALALFWFARRQKVAFIELLDLAAPALALAQAIGRWGNYVNQELYGAPTTLPWGLNIDAAFRVAGYTDPALRFHPLFLYESTGNALICLALLYLLRRYANRLKPGDLFLVYLVLYPVQRFLLDFIRLDNAIDPILRLNVNQTVMAVVAVVAGAMLISRHRRTRRHELKVSESVPAEGEAPPSP